jgi:hydroxyacylglutathione hydrolase
VQIPSVTPSDLRSAQEAGSQVVDVRVPVAYNREHIPGSVNIPYTRNGFAQQAAFFLRKASPVLLVTDSEPLAGHAAHELGGAGFEIHGVLEGGIAAWKSNGGTTATLGQMTADELAARMREGTAPMIVDVREQWEFQSRHIDGAKLLPLSVFGQKYKELRKEDPMVIVCASGARSGEATQFLYRLGYRHVYNLVGGMNAWLAGGRRA